MNARSPAIVVFLLVIGPAFAGDEALRITGADLDRLVKDLSGDDAGKAGRAVWKLVLDAPKQAVPLMAERLKPVAVPDEKKLAQLIKDLGSDDFDVRKTATEELEKTAELAELVLRGRLKDNPELEVKKRIDDLLDKIEKARNGPVVSARVLSAVRMIEVLEKIGTPEARKVLEDVSKGADGARVTLEAREALERLSRKRTQGAEPDTQKKPLHDFYGDPLPEGAIVRLGTTRFRQCSTFVFAPDGKTFATFRHKEVRICAVETGKTVHTFDLNDWVNSSLNAVAFSPDGKQLAVLDSCGDQLGVWDTGSGKQVSLSRIPEKDRFRNGPSHMEMLLAFTADGKRVFSSNTGRVHLRDVSDGSILSTLDYELARDDAIVYKLVVSPDRSIIACTAGGPSIRLWDAKSGDLRREFKVHESEDALTVAFSPDGKLLLTGGCDKTARLWDVATGKEIRKFEGHSKEVSAVAFTPDGKRIATGGDILGNRSPGDKQEVRIWDIETNKAPQKTLPIDAVDSLSFSPDGKVLACRCYGGSVRLFDWSSRKELNPVAAHQGTIRSIAFSPNGKELASAGDDRVIRQWDPLTGKLVGEMSGHETPINALAISPDGAQMASGDDDGTLVIWDAASRKKRDKWKSAEAGMHSLAFSPDGATLACANFNSVQLFDPKLLKQLAKYEADHEVTRIGISPDGKWIGSAEEKLIRVRNAKSGKVELEWPDMELGLGIAFSPDGRMVAASGDSNVWIYEMASGKERRSFAMYHGSGFDCLAFSPDSRYLATLSGQDRRSIHIRDLASGVPAYDFDQLHETVKSLAWSADGKTVATAGEDGAVLIWELARLPKLRAAEEVEQVCLKGHTESVNCVAFAPDGKTLASASYDKTVRIWDRETGKEVAVLQGHTGIVWTLAFSPDGKQIASGSNDKTIRLWDTASRKQLHVLEGHAKEIHDLAYSPDGKTLVSIAHRESIRFWDPETGKERKKIDGKKLFLDGVRFSNDGKTLAIAGGTDDESDDAVGFVQLWDAEKLEVRQTLRAEFPVNRLALSKDGNMLALGAGMEGSGTVFLWDLKTAKEKPPSRKPMKVVYAVAFSPDGKLLASVGTEDKVHLWDVESGKEMAALEGHAGGTFVKSVAFSPDGRWLVTGGTDKTIRLWSMANFRDKGHD